MFDPEQFLKHVKDRHPTVYDSCKEQLPENGEFTEQEGIDALTQALRAEREQQRTTSVSMTARDEAW